MEQALKAWSGRLGLPVPIDWVTETGSTNDDLRRRAFTGAPQGTALVADRQTGGRGRLGRGWDAPPGAAVLLSVVLRTRIPIARVPLLCLGAAVATLEASEATARAPIGLGIKWPNDVLAPDGRKVAGVLAELELVGGQVDFVVVGIGVNVGAAPPLPGASCLTDWAVEPLDRAALAARIVRGVLDLADLARRDASALLDRWRARSVTLGREVAVGEVRGRAEDIDADGALIVRTPEGPRRILAGDVTMIG